MQECMCTTAVCGLQYECGGSQRILIKAMDHAGLAAVSVWAGLNAFVLGNLSDAEQQQPLSLTNALLDHVPHCCAVRLWLAAAACRLCMHCCRWPRAALDTLAAALRAGSCCSHGPGQAGLSTPLR